MLSHHSLLLPLYLIPQQTRPCHHARILQASRWRRRAMIMPTTVATHNCRNGCSHSPTPTTLHQTLPHHLSSILPSALCCSHPPLHFQLCRLSSRPTRPVRLHPTTSRSFTTCSI
jgi:hypothetical protein